MSYWEKTLRSEASRFPSLSLFKSEFMSLSSPHPIWSTTGSNPYEVSKAIQQARLLSGRYRTESLCSHWSKNKHGWCQGTSCTHQVENLEHILLVCPSYAPIREKHFQLWMTYHCPITKAILITALTNEPSYILQILLDCSTLANVILAVQTHGNVILENLFKLTRTFCYAIHRQRLDAGTTFPRFILLD